MRAGRRRWAVFISGRGSNLAALLDLRDALDIALVVSSNPKAPGLLRAKRAGVPTWVTPKKINWVEVDHILRSRGVSDVFLAGFMKIVPAAFVQLWESRILNLHPSLLPAYPGLESIERAFEAEDDLGVSVHIVNEGVDEGDLVAQRRSLKVPKRSGYSLARSELQIHIDEQRLIREAILKWNPRAKLSTS